MYKDIITKERLIETAKTLSKEKFKPGYDGMSMQGAHAWMTVNGDRICRDIFNGYYLPMPAVGFRVAKVGGGFRQLARLTAIDTVIQTLLKDCLSQEAEKHFSDHSFAYRKGRGVHSALQRYVDLAGRYKLASTVDIRSCFSDIDHHKLEGAITDFFHDSKLCELMIKLAKTPIYIDDGINEPAKGILQGMPLAPLMCNLYFHSLDLFLEENMIQFIRYGDDIVIFGDSIGELNRFTDCASLYIQTELGLEINKKKQHIDSPVKIKYLGHSFSCDKRGIIAYGADSDIRSAYHSWYSAKPQNTKGRVDILSDGVLRQRNMAIFFDTDTRDYTLPPATTDRLNLYSDVTFDSGFLEFAMNHGISINIFDRRGNAVGSFTPAKPLKSPKLTHQQLMAYYKQESRLALAREFVLASVHNALLNIRYYNKQHKDTVLEAAVNKLTSARSLVKNVESYEQLLTLEAQCRCIYYGCYDSFIKKDDFVFEKRSKRPPKNYVNSLISFGNVVLYNHIAYEIEKTALDVRVGYLHATNTRYKSLNLDIAEIFRPLIVDRVVFTLINKTEISPSHFVTEENGGVYLNEEGKRIFLAAFYTKLDTTLDLKGRSLSYADIIRREVSLLVCHFRDKEKYKAFRQVR